MLWIQFKTRGNSKILKTLKREIRRLMWNLKRKRLGPITKERKEIKAYQMIQNKES